jgi:hypothetical protein
MSRQCRADDAARMRSRLRKWPSIRARLLARTPRAARAAWVSAAVLPACLGGGPASAHGFGQRYDLPLPLSLYLFAAASAVVVSFVIVALFVRHAPKPGYPRLSLHPGDGWTRALALTLKSFALGLFFVVVAAGLVGDQNPYRNIAPTFVWIIVWIGLAYVSAFLGNVWALVNPWRTMFDCAAALYRRIGQAELSYRVPYPRALGVWPACLMLLAFSWTELVYPGAAVPAHIAWLATGYSVLTLAGMTVFGPATWLSHGEMFSVVFATLARIAPTEVRVSDPAVCAVCELDCRADGACIDCHECFAGADPRRRELALRPWGAGLIDGRAASPSMIGFVLLLLATVLFDGFLNTPEWSMVENAAPDLGEAGAIAIRTAGLIAFWLILLGAYCAVSVVMSVGARSSAPAGGSTPAGATPPHVIAQSFVFTLVPIAVGYHVAHYLMFLLLQGQYIFPLLSDPFGYGWNLMGTADYRPDIGLVGPRFGWYAAVAAILSGHVAAVYLAHRKAVRMFPARRAALSSQVPLTALMVVYTVVSLSILAEPLVERRAPGEPAEVAAIAIPEDAVLPDADGRLPNVGPGRAARARLTYQVLGSAFHDGTRTTPADLLYAYVFAYRWSQRGEGADASIDAATAPLRRALAGLRVVRVDAASRTFRVGDVSFVREILSIEIYATVAPPDPERDAPVAAPWSTLPWHLVVLMEEAVTRGWAAFSQGEAARRGLPWLDIVRSEAMNGRLAALVTAFERDAYRPEALRPLVSEDEARKRWAALATFHREHGHFLVTNGPYRLKRWSADSVTLQAFRDLTYPLGVGSYDAYAVPRRGYVTDVQVDGGRITLSGDIEVVDKFQRSYRLVRTPLKSVAPEVLRRATPEGRYAVIDESDRVALAGVARLDDDATFKIEVAGRLKPGRYTMSALIAVNGNVVNADIRRIPLVVP